MSCVALRIQDEREMIFRPGAIAEKAQRNKGAYERSKRKAKQIAQRYVRVPMRSYCKWRDKWV